MKNKKEVFDLIGGDDFEKALSNAARAIENVSKTLLEYFKNLKRYKPMKMRKRRARTWQKEEESQSMN